MICTLVLIHAGSICTWKSTTTITTTITMAMKQERGEGAERKCSVMMRSASQAVQLTSSNCTSASAARCGAAFKECMHLVLTEVGQGQNGAGSVSCMQPTYFCTGYEAA